MRLQGHSENSWEFSPKTKRNLLAFLEQKRNHQPNWGKIRRLANALVKIWTQRTQPAYGLIIKLRTRPELTLLVRLAISS
jgi:hypothetical protein